MRKIYYYSAWILLVLSVSVTFYSAAALYRKSQENALISRLNNNQAPETGSIDSSSPAVGLAYSSYLTRRQRYDEALAILSRISKNLEDNKLKRVSLYNLGNLYLKQAMEAATQMRIDDAMALTGLAKNIYRRVLQLDSRHWDAKYNLEVAMRLLPEMQRVNIQDEQPEQKKGRPWTSIPGFPRGLP